jgi:hypothetical protein
VLFEIWHYFCGAPLALEKNKRKEVSISQLDKTRKEFKLSLTDELERRKKKERRKWDEEQKRIRNSREARET